MSADEIRWQTQQTWDRFYALCAIWKRSSWLGLLRERLAFVLVSKLYRQMYASAGVATDSARMLRATRWARWLAVPCQRLFVATPIPDLQVPDGMITRGVGPGMARDGRQSLTDTARQSASGEDEPVVPAG